MAKVHHVKKARKHHRRFGVKKGQEYWWWKRRAPGQRVGFKVVSPKKPKPSQVEGNPYRATILEFQERCEADPTADTLREVAAELEELAEEQEEKRRNMPNQLQDSDAGQMLEARAAACRSLASELETAASEIEDLEMADDPDGDGNPGEGDCRPAAEEIVGAISWEVE